MNRHSRTLDAAQVLTIRTFKMADCPFDEAAAEEQERWGAFGRCEATRPDGRTGFVLTDVTVTRDTSLIALEAAVGRRASSTIVVRRTADA